MRMHPAFLLALLAALVLASPVAAQEAPATGFMDAALADHERAADRQRAQLTELLALPEVRDLAGAHGIEMERVEASAQVLTDAELAGLAPLLESVSKAMAAQQLGTIRISVVAIIIILLILILVT